MAGGLALLWRKDIDLNILSYSQHNIDSEVTFPGETSKWRFIGFYGVPEQHLRHRSWDLLRQLSSHNSLQWLIGGDFNEILLNIEKSGGLIRSQGMMDAFRDGLADCYLEDLGFLGEPFTWSNQRAEPHTVRCRLNSFCVNSTWRVLVPSASVHHLTCPGSDHVPLLIKFREQHQDGPGRRRRPWRFNAHWVRKQECEQVVREGWESAVAPDCFDRLFSGIEACQLGLRQWARDIHNNPRKVIEKLREQLYANSMAPQTEENRTEGVALRAELEKVHSDEDIFWRQRSKVMWAREGDRNTTYFHQAATARKEKNTIHGLYNQEGVWCEEEKDIEGIIRGYFGELFQSSYPSEAMIEEVLEKVDARVTSEMNSKLSLPFSPEEVFSAIYYLV